MQMLDANKIKHKKCTERSKASLQRVRLYGWHAERCVSKE